LRMNGKWFQCGRLLMKRNALFLQTASFSTIKEATFEKTLRRILFYVPGSDAKKIEKATGLGIDSVVLDVEDGVASNMKDHARNTIHSFLHSSSLSFGKSEILNEFCGVWTGRGRFENDCICVR